MADEARRLSKASFGATLLGAVARAYSQAAEIALAGFFGSIAAKVKASSDSVKTQFSAASAAIKVLNAQQRIETWERERERRIAAEEKEAARAEREAARAAEKAGKVVGGGAADGGDGVSAGVGSADAAAVEKAMEAAWTGVQSGGGATSTVGTAGGAASAAAMAATAASSGCDGSGSKRAAGTAGAPSGPAGPAGASESSDGAADKKGADAGASGKAGTSSDGGERDNGAAAAAAAGGERALTAEELAERQRLEDEALPLMLDAMWAANAIDISSTLSRVTH
eukprot:361427-Chlamydomonas_euryale.AAC.1